MPIQGTIYDIQRMSVHDGPGLRTTVFFKGCPLRCRWCSNPESQALHPQLLFFKNLCTGCGTCLEVCPASAIIRKGNIVERDFSKCTNCGACASFCPTTASSLSGREYSVDEVLEIIRKDSTFYNNSGGGVTFGGGECSLQGEFLIALLKACQNEGIHTCVDTCGQTDPMLFQDVLEMADLLLFDVKHMDSSHHKGLTGVGNERILGNLETALSAYPEKVRIRIPLMPGLNDSDENVSSVAALLEKYGVGSVDILPCHSFGSNKYDALMLEQPNIPEYSPQELQNVLTRFADHNLKTEIV